MEKLKNKPSLRFPEFDGEWELKKLGEVAELTSSKRVYANDYVAEGIPFYRGKEITELKENKKPSDILFISKSAYEKFKKSYGVPQINDLLITAVGTLGNVLTIKNNDPFYFKDGNLIWLRNVNQNSIFLEINLHFNFKEIEKSAIGSSQKALTMVELRKLHFSFPKLTEQTKIASFLTAVDDKLQALKQKKTLLEQYKKGVMQKIFSQELRFKDDNGNGYPDWEEKKLGDLCNYKNGGSFENFVSNEGSYNLISLNSIDINGKLKKQHKRVTITDNSLQKGDLIMVLSDVAHGNFLGLTDIIPNDEFVLNQRMAALKPKTDFNSFYLKTFINFNQSYFKLMGQGSSQLNLSKGDVENFAVKLPIFEEQTKIADFLSAIDDKIIHCQSQIEKTEVWKKGLLQQLFV